MWILHKQRSHPQGTLGAAGCSLAPREAAQVNAQQCVCVYLHIRVNASSPTALEVQRQTCASSRVDVIPADHSQEDPAPVAVLCSGPWTSGLLTGKEENWGEILYCKPTCFSTSSISEIYNSNFLLAMSSLLLTGCFAMHQPSS